MAKKDYPGGFRLTLATARKLAVQEFGTDKGLKADNWAGMEGYFLMEMGNLYVSIRPDIKTSGCIEVRVGLCTAGNQCVGYFDPKTLEPNYEVMDMYERRERRAALELWVYGKEPESCHKLIDEIWNRGR